MPNVSSSEALVHCSVAAGVHRANETLVKTGRMGRSCIRCDRRGPALPEHRNVALRWHFLLLSNICLIAYAVQIRALGLLMMQIVFMATSFTGMVRWMV